MRVLVTGGAGYIGGVVTEQLLAAGHQAVILDNLSRGHRAVVPPGVPFVHGDVGDAAVVQAALRTHRIEAVMHLAAFALVAESVAHPEMYQQNNVAAGRVLLDATLAAGVRRFVFSSSCATYGHPAVTPITEDTPQQPVNPYGRTKLEFEGLLARAAAEHGLTAVSLRYFNAAGATERLGEDHDPESHLVPNVLGAALGTKPPVPVYGTDYPTPDGTAVRDYVHIADIADAHVQALGIAPNGAVAFNLGTGTGQSVRQVLEAAGRVTGRAIPFVDQPRRPGDPPVLVAAAERARTALGWTPHRSALAAILESAWRWHRAHPRGYGSS
ncbi:MAG TPA: UDP-glucose 4-epimerase GalE [Gemmatimonadales bacterium]